MYSTSLLTKTQQRREEFCNFILLFAVWSCHQTVMLLIINRNISIFLVKLFCSVNVVFSSYSFQHTFSWWLKVSLYPTALLFAFHCTAFCVAHWKVSIFFFSSLLIEFFFCAEKILNWKDNSYVISLHRLWSPSSAYWSKTFIFWMKDVLIAFQMDMSTLK